MKKNYNSTSGRRTTRNPSVTGNSGNRSFQGKKKTSPASTATETKGKRDSGKGVSGRKPFTGKPAESKGAFSADKPAVRKYRSKTHGEKRRGPGSATGEIRLNRYIANAGICSRREADTYITAGLVTINGKIVSELGTKVKPGDDVRFDGKRLEAEKKVYLLLNKPKNYVTTTDDPHAEQTVMDIVKDACEERIYPVGRLDRNTTGLLLFTNDGDLSKKLTHPSHRMKKIYQVSLDKALTKEHMFQIAEGIELEDGPVAADAISYISPDDKTEIGMEIHSGKNRVVRRIFEHLGYRVKKLDRVLFAGLTKKNLPRGKYRFLTEKEIQFLKMQ